MKANSWHVKGYKKVWGSLPTSLCEHFLGWFTIIVLVIPIICFITGTMILTPIFLISNPSEAEYSIVIITGTIFYAICMMGIIVGIIRVPVHKCKPIKWEK